MNVVESQDLIAQAEYAKKLRPFLPPEAFSPDPNKLWILLINLTILVLGWTIARRIDQQHWYLLWLYLPLALLMGNSIIVLLFSSHELMHGSVIRNARLARAISLFGLAMLWMPPTLWKAVHNRTHHNHTNSLKDPDRNYLYEQPNTWGKRIQHLFVPSMEVSSIGLVVGMAMAWGVHTFRNQTSVLLFNRETVAYVPAAFTVSAKERQSIAQELGVVLAIHLSVLVYLQLHPLRLLLGYFLPISIGYAGILFYVYTNHMLCRMTEVNDPLMNSVSIRVLKIFDLLHLNFSYHTEHHIFPGLNSDYYPVVQKLIHLHYPDRAGEVVNAGEAWRLLLQTPRHYQDETALTSWSGKTSVNCPFSKELESL